MQSRLLDAEISVGFFFRAVHIRELNLTMKRNRFLKRTAEMLRDKFDSDVPKTVDELCSLPGVGPKMAFLTLQVAWNM